jgi:hypothetical protein
MYEIIVTDKTKEYLDEQSEKCKKVELLFKGLKFRLEKKPLKGTIFDRKIERYIIKSPDKINYPRIIISYYIDEQNALIHIEHMIIKLINCE